MRSWVALGFVCMFSAGVSAQREQPLPKELPAYGPEVALKSPKAETAKLGNGLTVWLVSTPGLPKIAIAVAVRGGLAADPKDLPGISELLSKTIDQGTKSRTAREIAEQLQAAGGDLSVDEGKDSITVSTSVLSSKAEPALMVLVDVLQNATFPDAEVSLAKRNLSDSLREKESTPSFLAGRAMAKVLFGGSTYAVTSATQQSIEATTPGDLRKVYGERFRPDQAVLVAVGDFRTEEMLGLLKGKFGGWKAGTGPVAAVPARFDTLPKHAVYLVQRPGSVQTTLRLGTMGPLRSDPDFAATQLANAIYGSMFSSRLVSNIREDKGYTYSPGASQSTYRGSGVLMTRADVRNEVTGASFNEITYELNRMATTSPTEEELTKAKRFLIGIEAIRLQARASVAAELSRLWILGLPPEEIGEYGKKVGATTSADVDGAGRKYFPATRTAVVAVGEEKVIREALAPLGVSVETAP